MTWPQRPGSSAEAPSVPKGWRPLWNIDWTAESDHDFLTEGSYTDAAGTTWDPTDDTINGEGSASALEIQNGVGLVVTTQDNDDAITLGQTLADILAAAGYDLENWDRLFIGLDLDTSTITTNFQYAMVRVGQRADFQTASADVFRMSRGYSSGNYSALARSIAGTQQSKLVSPDSSDAIGLMISGQGAEGYYKSSWGAPITGWTRVPAHAAWNENPSTYDANQPFLDDSWAVWDFRRNGSTNLTYTIRRMALYGWVPSWAGD